MTTGSSEILQSSNAQLEESNIKIQKELAEKTGIPVEKIDLELIEKYKGIEKRLDFLAIKTEKDISKKISMTHELLEGKSINIENSARLAATEVLETAQEALEDTPNAVAEWASKKAGEKINDKISSLPFGLGSVFSNIGEKISELLKPLFASATSLFGGMGLTKWFKDKFGWGKPDKSTDITDTSSDTETTPNRSGDEESVNKEAEYIEGGIDSKFSIGATTIIALNGSLGDEGKQSPKSTYLALKDMDYTQISALSSTQPTEDFYSSEENKEIHKLYTKIIESLQSDKTQDLLRIGLQHNSLQRIIKPYGKINIKLFKHFGETDAQGKKRLEEILKKSEKNKDYWKELSFQEISILYFENISTLKVPAIEGILNTSQSVNTLMFGENSPFNSENTDFDSYIPKSLLLGFGTLGSDLAYNNYMDSSLNTEIHLKVFKNMPKEDIEKNEEIFKRIMEFKEKIIKPEFYTNAKLGLTTIKQQELFKDNLTLSYTLALFSILGGNSDLSNISPLSFPPLLFITGKIISGGDESNSLDAGIYMGGYIKNILSETSSPLNEDELTILKIYGEKIIDMIFLSHIKTMANALGIQEGLTGINTTELAIGTFVGGTAFRVGANRIIGNALKNGKVSLGGIWLKRTGNIGMLAGLLLGGVSWYTNANGDNFSKRMNKAIDNNDFQGMLEAMKEQEKSVQTIPGPNGKEVKVLAFPGDTPLYIIDGKVYGVKVGNLNIKETWEKSDKDGWGTILDMGQATLDTILPPTGTKDQIDYSVQAHDGEYITFGNSPHIVKVKMSDIINKALISQEDVIGEDVVREIWNGERSLPILGNEGERGYVIQVLGTQVMFLAELGEAKDMFAQDS